MADGEAAHILLLEPSQIGTAVDVLAHAFDDDPGMRALFPRSRSRADQKIRVFLEGYLRYGLRYGEVHVGAAAVDSVAIWLPSEHAFPTIAKAVRAGGLWSTLRLGPAAIVSMLRLDRVMGDLHQELLDRPHWHLSLVGVDPSAQGTGCAGGLLRPMLTRARAEGRPCYVETNLGSNVPFYEHLGFTLVGHRELPDSEVGLWALIRE